MNGIIFHLTDTDTLKIRGEEIHALANDTVQILIEGRSNPCTYGINDFTRVACLMVDTYLPLSSILQCIMFIAATSNAILL